MQKDWHTEGQISWVCYAEENRIIKLRSLVKRVQKESDRQISRCMRNGALSGITLERSRFQVWTRAIRKFFDRADNVVLHASLNIKKYNRIQCFHFCTIFYPSKTMSSQELLRGCSFLSHELDKVLALLSEKKNFLCSRVGFRFSQCSTTYHKGFLLFPV